MKLSALLLCAALVWGFLANPPETSATPGAISTDSKIPKDRPVASVGDEVITLPELTGAVKERIAQLPPEASPSRRQVIALARSVLKAMVVRSLVMQEAREVLGGSDGLAQSIARIEERWTGEERPALLKREGVTGEDDLRKKLGPRLSSPEAVHDEFVVRSLALELMERGGRGRDLDGYLAELRTKRPIVAMMSPAELIAEGSRVAAEDDVVR